MKFFYRCRKAHMTLLETLIAMGLLAFLLTFVFGFFRELSAINQMTEQAQKKSFQMRYVESRLGFIFERITHDKSNKDKFYFYSENPQQEFTEFPSLIFTFDNEVRIDPTFSGDILARLYVDLNRRLCLAMWPLYIEDPDKYLQEEVLLDNIDSIKFSFFSPPARINSTNDIAQDQKTDSDKKTPQKNKWHDEWFISYKQMPAMLKLELDINKSSEVKNFSKEDSKNKKDSLIFQFVLPTAINTIHYPVD